MARLQTAWQAAPDLRLGQLLANAFRDLYYVEDDALLTEVERLISRAPRS